jgi:hypothetical protein
VDPVLLGRLRGQHQDRHLRKRPDLARHLLAGHVRQAQVEDEQVRRRGTCERNGLGARLGGQDAEAFAFEIAADEVADLALVLDDEDGGGATVHANRLILG